MQWKKLFDCQSAVISNPSAQHTETAIYRHLASPAKTWHTFLQNITWSIKPSESYLGSMLWTMGLQTFLSKGHISLCRTCRGPDVIRNVIVAGYVIYYKIKKFFVRTDIIFSSLTKWLGRPDEMSSRAVVWRPPCYKPRVSKLRPEVPTWTTVALYQQRKNIIFPKNYVDFVANVTYPK